jgi:prevent-host-death family protein
MTRSIREARAKLSSLVESAARGEEIIITSHGKPRAKLVAIPTPPRRALDMNRIRRLAKSGRTKRRSSLDSTNIISELREDR